MGAVAEDLSPNQYNGALSGPPTWVAGKFGKALSFTGTQYVNMATHPNPVGSFSVSFWFNTSDSFTNHRAFMHHGGVVAQDGFMVRMEFRQVEFSIRKSTLVTIDSPLTYADGKWHHVVAVFASGASITLYVDGIKVATSATTITDVSNSNSFDVGRDTNGFFWSGLLDEIREYGAALSDGGVSVGQTAGGDVAALFNAPVQGNALDFLAADPNRQVLAETVGETDLLVNGTPSTGFCFDANTGGRTAFFFDAGGLVGGEFDF